MNILYPYGLMMNPTTHLYLYLVSRDAQQVMGLCHAFDNVPPEDLIQDNYTDDRTV